MLFLNLAKRVVLACLYQNSPASSPKEIILKKRLRILKMQFTDILLSFKSQERKSRSQTIRALQPPSMWSIPAIDFHKQQMPRLPSFKPREIVKILKRNGFVELRQIGNHLHLFHSQRKIRVTVPMHNKDLKRKTLASIVRQAKIKI